MFLSFLVLVHKVTWFYKKEIRVSNFIDEWIPFFHSYSSYTIPMVVTLPYLPVSFNRLVEWGSYRLAPVVIISDPTNDRDFYF